jgi:hypothetical protein
MIDVFRASRPPATPRGHVVAAVLVVEEARSQLGMGAFLMDRGLAWRLAMYGDGDFDCRTGASCNCN